MSRSAVIIAPYRPDIDGLRAISVAAVVLFHAEYSWADGGFIGVDVFFVISGYLITQWLLVRESIPGRQLIQEFYVRRIRRILPALLLMLAVSSAVALWLLQPADLVRFGRYLVAAAFMGGNFTAAADGDYFAATMGFAPLLHLWSIAVEEQFYLVYPLLLLGLRRWPARRRAWVLGILAAASFALCLWGSVNRPVANFYIGITRGWELLLGALAAHGLFDFRNVTRLGAPLAATGLGAIVLAIMTFHRDMGLPGAATLLPAGGTLLLLVAGRGGPNGIAVFLGWRPLMATGLASYSLYLWHLPLLVFGSYWSITTMRGARLLALLALIVLLSFASWAWFEVPLRQRRWLPDKRRFLRATSVALLLMALLGATLWWSEGLPGRLPLDQQRLLASATLHPKAVECMTRSLAEISAGQLCRFGALDPRARRVVLWGDSHALALLPGLEQVATRDSLALFYAGRSACSPLLARAEHRHASRKTRECDDYNAAMREAVERLRPTDVLMAAFWALSEPDATPGERAQSALPDALRDTVGALRDAGARVCLIRDVPVLVRPVPYGLVMARRRGVDPGFLRYRDAAWKARNLMADATLLAIADSEPGVRSVNPRALICDETTCQIEEAGEVLFRDSNHLSVRGALRVAPALESCFDSRSSAR